MADGMFAAPASHSRDDFLLALRLITVSRPQLQPLSKLMVEIRRNPGTLNSDFMVPLSRSYSSAG